jgi:predicted metal-dependent HD superfamily phosphohydrolase
MAAEGPDEIAEVEQAWWRACRDLWGGIDDENAIDRGWLVLRAMYHDPPRAYHNLGHVAECLRVCDARGGALEYEHQAEVAFALLCHDCVYDSRRHDNEERSAGVGSMLARDLGFAPRTVQDIHRLVMATTHKGTPSDVREALIRDVDLSSLAAEPDVFDANTRAIREEFSWASEDKWKAGRAAFFRDMLGRRAIYFTPEMHAEFEARARENLARGLLALGE